MKPEAEHLTQLYNKAEKRNPYRANIIWTEVRNMLQFIDEGDEVPQSYDRLCKRLGKL